MLGYSTTQWTFLILLFCQVDISWFAKSTLLKMLKEAYLTLAKSQVHIAKFTLPTPHLSS